MNRTSSTATQKMTESTSPSQPSAQESASNPSIAPETAPKLISKVPGTKSDDIETNALFSDYLGLSIAPFNQPNHEGTKGLYLRRRDTGVILLLTCRRVVFGDGVPNNEYRHDGTKESWAIIQPGNDTLCEHKSSLEFSIKCDIDWMARLEKRSNMPEQTVNVEAELQRLKPRIALDEQKLLQDTMPEEELRDPRSATLPWDSAIVVMKHGVTTGLTIGSVAGAVSVVRRTHGNVTLGYEEWCALREKERMGEGRRKRFSAAGDSGSCVFDSFGRVVGISSGGGREVPESDGVISRQWNGC
ncbi:hypothetical protein NW754_010761 [Fusarium falciforme]|nr:hypothetical protein NW754_010761 [Fusarium falciforme]